jgi:hypothetical protein
MPQPLDYQSPTPTRPRFRVDRAIIAAGIVALVAIAINVLLLVDAESDPGFGAMAALLLASPICNGILLVVSLVFIPLASRHSSGRSIIVYILVSGLLPVSAAGFNLYFLTIMRPY